MSHSAMSMASVEPGEGIELPWGAFGCRSPPDRDLRHVRVMSRSGSESFDIRPWPAHTFRGAPESRLDCRISLARGCEPRQWLRSVTVASAQ